jgi:hypothetical protein
MFQKFFEADHAVVIDYFHGLGMGGFAAFEVFVFGEGRIAVGIANPLYP